jgi:hypothetical protein
MESDYHPRMPEPTTHEHPSSDWSFPVPVDAEVITTRFVLDDGRPILRVSHDDDDGTWQLLCGTTTRGADGRVGCLGCLAAKDPTLGELADLPRGWVAHREAAGAPWTREKPKTQIELLREAVERSGFQLVLFPPQRPLWAFTVGLTKTFSQPEVLVFGLPPRVLNQMVMTLARMAADGESFVHGYRTDMVLENFTCELRTIDPTWHEILLGPLKAFHEGESLSMLQCTWPDKQGKLPHEDGYDVAFNARQPRLEHADPEKAGMMPLLRAMGGV